MSLLVEDMIKTLSPFLLLLAIQVSGQRIVPTSPIHIANTALATNATTSSSGRMFLVGGGEFKPKSFGRIGFDAMYVRTFGADLNHIQKNSMVVAGFNVLLFDIEGFSSKIYISQGFDMRQSITRFSARESVTFEGLTPAFSLGMGFEYKINRHFCAFSRLRWVGGDITDLGNDRFQYGQFILHTGISCKIIPAKKLG